MRSSANKMADTEPPWAGDRRQVVTRSANLWDVCVCGSGYAETVGGHIQR